MKVSVRSTVHERANTKRFNHIQSSTPTVYKADTPLHLHVLGLQEEKKKPQTAHRIAGKSKASKQIKESTGGVCFLKPTLSPALKSTYHINTPSVQTKDFNSDGRFYLLISTLVPFSFKRKK